MENHNFTQPPTQTDPQQILGNPAAPFMNSLITSGNPNAAQVSFATAYFNSGTGVHPSEPNYVWAEAGSDFGVHTDADPELHQWQHLRCSAFDRAVECRPHSVEELSGRRSICDQPNPQRIGDEQCLINPYYGTGQYNYAVKHNPMAFFGDTWVQNVYPLAQLFDDLNHNAVGQYNWITPNQFNDAHSALSGGFTYHGTHYTGDQAAIAQGDNFLSIVVPQIMASREYQNNGVIIIWWDETEGGDDTSRTLGETVISPLAKGNAYASSVVFSHSSDLKTMEEIFGLPSVNNPIPASETNNFGGFNNVATANDLSDLFVSGAIPAPASASVTGEGFVFHPDTQTYSQEVHVRNDGTSPIPEPVWVALDNLSANAMLLDAGGTTAVLAPLGSPYVSVPVGGDGILRPNEVKTLHLEFLDPSGDPITYVTRVLDVTPGP